MSQELNAFYSKPQKMVHFPLENMCCAFLSKNNMWYRGRIVQVNKDGTCEIYMTEYGRRERIHWMNIMHLEEKFIALNEGVIQCRLKDVQPKKEDNYQWSKQALLKFKNLCLSSNLKMCICSCDPITNVYDVTLFIIQATRDICINALLVNSKFCISTGVESAREELTKIDKKTEAMDETMVVGDENVANDEGTPTKKLKQLRKVIKILTVFSPSEFYVFMEKNSYKFNKLHRDIQHDMNAVNEKIVERRDDWAISNLCFTFTKTKYYSQPQWFRARVTEVHGGSKYSVFLIDCGLYVDCTNENMAEMNDTYRMIIGGALRCHLTCLKPTAGQTDWTGFVKDEFRYFTEIYDEYAITLYGPKDQTISFPVFLWGMNMECTDPLAPTVYKWTNINQVFADRGICHSTQNFSNILEEVPQLTNANDDFEKFLSELDEALNKHHLECNYDENEDYSKAFQLSDETTPIEEWQPAEPIGKTIFMGIPTYIDDNGIVYMHHVDSGDLIVHIKLVSSNVSVFIF